MKSPTCGRRVMKKLPYSSAHSAYYLEPHRPGGWVHGPCNWNGRPWLPRLRSGTQRRHSDAGARGDVGAGGKGVVHIWGRVAGAILNLNVL
jgi:hypothetical protein